MAILAFFDKEPKSTNQRPINQPYELKSDLKIYFLGSPMCVLSFKEGFTSLSLKTRLLGEEKHSGALCNYYYYYTILTTTLLYDVPAVKEVESDTSTLIFKPCSQPEF